MGYLPQIRQQALALIKEGYSAEKVADILSKKLEDETSEQKSPCAQTIRRWSNEVKKWDRQRIESAENAREFLKTHPIPKWLQNMYLVKIENGEIKPL
jgi:hypothetical protein